MSKDPDEEFNKLIKKIIRDSSHLYFLTFTLDENLKKIKPALSNVSKFKEKYDTKHSELELRKNVVDLLDNLSYAYTFTSNIKRNALTLQN